MKSPLSRRELRGQRALITGASDGIGKGLALALARRGVDVVLAARGAERLEGVAASCRALGVRAIAIPTDIGDPEACRALATGASAELGGLDIVVNNAAILRDALVFKGEPRDWDAVIQTGLNAAYYLIRAATPVMRQQFKDGRGTGGKKDRVWDWGRIVNMGSTAGLYGNYGQASYGATKGGLFSLTRITAMEMARSKVTANFIAPFAHTRVTDIIEPANEAQATYKERALKVGASHVATFVTYLCSDAARDISGQIFGVRGREVFLFSQPRPIAHFARRDTDWTPETLGPAVEQDFREHLVDLSTDLEAFNTEPYV